MLRFRDRQDRRQRDELTRRDFMRIGAASVGGAMTLSLSNASLAHARPSPAREINCIQLFLVGGPSHLDTWDLKPGAPENVRGPFKPIKTNVSGVEICEHLPRMARMAERYAIVRSVHHDAAPVHETGHQLMQTGHLFRNGQQHPHFGSMVSHLRGVRAPGVPPFVVLPFPIGNTGVTVDHGQTAGYLGSDHEPFFFPGSAMAETYEDQAWIDRRQALFASEATPGNRPVRLPANAERNAIAEIAAGVARNAFNVEMEPTYLRERYGQTAFGQSCLMARRLVEHGVRFVTVNMFDTVFNKLSWDCHADGGSLAVNLDDYKQSLCPMFDQAYSSLLEDLAQRGMLETTMVVAMGEFGRTPYINPRGGRDHWPGVWSVLFAGGRVTGGQVIGASDAIGGEPADRPVTPAEIAATIYEGMSIDPGMSIEGFERQSRPISEAGAIAGLLDN